MPYNKAKFDVRSLALLLAMAVFVLAGIAVSAQDNNRRRRQQSTSFNQSVVYKPDSVVMTDSLRAVLDSIAVADSLFKADSTRMMGHSSLEAPAFTGAKDSIRQKFVDGGVYIYYYGDVKVKYADMELEADYMEYDTKSGTVYARGTLDTLTGEWKGQPVMKQGGSTYSMEEIRYNFTSKKARITNMVTQQQEGLLHGKSIKMMPDQSINIDHGRYTVCDLEEPHYYVKLWIAKRTKDGKIVFGPAWPVLEDVPAFPVVLPFGFVPKKPTRATGLLMPTFGEENARGFYMRDMGMYFVFGDYLDFSLTGDVYTLGSWSLEMNSRYKVNYKFNGNFSLIYSNDQAGERGSTDFFQSKNFGVRWSHSQDSKAHPGTSFSASVNFSSPSNNRYNATDVSSALENQASSSISFSKNWNGKFNLSINALHSQNSRDSSYSFTLPNLTFSVSRFYPFKQKVRVGKEKFYEKISFGYNTSLQNKIAFKASEFMQEGFTDRFQNGMTHSFQIGLPNFTLAKYFNFTPGVSYGMNWYFRKSDYAYDQESGKVVQQMGKQFGTFGITQNYSGNIGMSTRLYGMFNFGKAHRIQAIRHVVSPSISLSVSPEKGTAANGWRTLTYTDKNGDIKNYDYNIYAGQMSSPPGKGRSATASLSIGNNIEAKVRDLRDTTGKGVKKVKLIDQLSINTGYNFLADSLNMSNISMSMSTNIFEKVGISGSASFDPYAVDGRGRRINRFSFIENGLGKALRLTNASLSMSYSLSGKGEVKGNDGSKEAGGDGGRSAVDYYKRVYYHPVTGEYIPGGWLYYTNPNVPWSVNFSYSFAYSSSYQYSNNQLIKNNRFTQTLSMSGNIKLSPKMSINASTGFDLMAMKMTTTQISGTYDLHCFNIAVSWVPTGQWQSWSFRIAANAAALSDLLKFKKSTSYWDRR